MLSSSDVAQIFAQQNQFFMGQNQFASSIGVSNPNLSLGAVGSDPRQKAFGASGTFGGHAPVSYAQSGMTSSAYGGGNRFAGGAMSLMGGVGTAAASLAFNPIGAAMGGAGMTGGVANLMGASGISRGIGGLVGGGMAGGALALGATMMPMMAASQGFGAMVGGAQGQQAIQGQLGGFGFQNSQSRTGQGFTRDDAQSIGTNIRNLAHIPEMMTSVEELTKLIPKLKSSGLMSGVRDASEFNTRFKEAVKTLRDVSKVLGTSMEEASQFFEHSRSVGYLGRKDQIKNAMNVQFTAAQTGMSTPQVMQLQQGGAQMAVGRGIRREVGATAVTNMAQQFGRGLQSGNIAQSDLEDMTGVSGEAAVGAAAQQMTEKLARFAESTGAGKASMMGLAEFDDKGRYKGINKELAQKYANGEVSKEELMRRIAGFSSQQKIAASRKVGSMAIEFAGATGSGGAMSFMKNVLAEGGHTGESAKYMMQKNGFSEVEVEVMSQMEGMGGVGGGGDDRKKRAYERKRQMEADIQDRTDPSKIMARMGTKLKGAVGLDKVEQEGSKMFSFIGKAYDEFIDDVVGRYSVQLSEKGAQRLSQAFQSKKGRDDLKELFALKMPAPGFSVMGTVGAAFKMSSMGQAFGGAKSLLKSAGAGFHEGLGDVEGQQKYMQESFGMEEGNSTGINERLKQLQGMGGTASSELKEQVQGMVDRLDRDNKYSDASSPEKMKMLAEEMHLERAKGRFGLGNKSFQENLKKFQKENNLGAGGEDLFAASAGALAPNLSSSGSEADMRRMMKGAAKSEAAADTHLDVVFQEDTSALLKTSIASDYQVGTTLRRALDSGGTEVEAALRKTDVADGVEALNKALGRTDVTEAEFKKTQEVHKKILGDLPSDKTEAAAKKAEMSRAIGFKSLAVATKDINVTKIAAGDLAGKMGKGELKSALEEYAAADAAAIGGDKGLFQKLKKTMESQAGRLLEAQKGIKSASTPAARKAAQEKMNALHKELGDETMNFLQGSMSKTGQDLAGVKEFGSKKEMAEKLGLDETMLGKLGDVPLGAGGKIKVTSDLIEKAKAIKAGAGGMNLISGSPEQKKQERDEHLSKTLEGIDNTLKLVNTNLSLQKGGGVFGYGESDDHKAAEAARAKAEGKTP